MSKIDEAREILLGLGFPASLLKPVVPITFLAIVAVGPDDNWASASRSRRRVRKEIMDFSITQFGVTWKENTRESVRKDALHHFIRAGIIDVNPFDPSLSTNSSNYHYAATEDALRAIRAFGTNAWPTEATRFREVRGSLSDIYAMLRPQLGRVPVTLPDGSAIELSAGEHNVVQKAVIELFAPRFAAGSVVLYLGDTANKDLIMERDWLEELGFQVTQHDKLPDIVLYHPEKNWIFLIEVVTSRGPMSPKRVLELMEHLEGVKASPVYVTAFPDLDGFRKHVKDIAWETEIWLADAPDHMIHFNGDRFLGPHGAHGNSRGG